jgi:uncharacterized protein involved in oxidation of intracellular sulfur
MENNEKVVYVATHFEDNKEKALLPFVLANAAFAMDSSPVVILQAEAVTAAVKGQAARIVHAPFDSLEKLLNSYTEMGGQLLVCSPCLKARNYSEADLVPNAQVVGAAKIIEEVSTAKTVMTY